MATLGIQVFADAKEVLFGEPLQIMSVAVGGASVQSGTVIGSRKEMRHVRLFTDTDCYVIWGDNPTATDFTDSLPLGAENPEVVGVQAGQKIAVITRA